MVKYEVNLKIFKHHTNSYTPLERISYVKYLGVLIDENLSWKHHILHIASKISISIGIIARLRHFVPFNTLQHFYRSLIQTLFLIRYNGVESSRKNSQKQNLTSSETHSSPYVFL